MEIVKLMVIVLGANGLWKLVEVLLKLRTDRKQKIAETSNLFAQVNSQVVGNWVQWSQKLEEQVKRLEDITSRQRERINELEKHVGKLQTRNNELEGELKELRNSKEENGQ